MPLFKTRSSLINLHTACEPARGRAIFLSKGHNLNKLGRVLLGDAICQYQGSRSSGWDRRNMFRYIILCIIETCDPLVSQFCSQGHYLNKLCRGLLDDATYQLSRLCVWGFLMRFFMFPYISQCKTGDPRAYIIWAYLASRWYQVSKPCGFRTKNEFLMFPYRRLRKTCLTTLKLPPLQREDPCLELLKSIGEGNLYWGP